MTELSPEAQLDACLGKFEPAISELASAVLSRVRELVPGAFELVYDAYNALSIGFGKSEKLGDCILHVAIYPTRVNLGFNRGTEVDDPDGLLEGTGRLIRHVTIESAAALREAKLAKLVRAALVNQDYLPANGKMVIKKIYQNQRSRRPAAPAKARGARARRGARSGAAPRRKRRP